MYEGVNWDSFCARCKIFKVSDRFTVGLADGSVTAANYKDENVGLVINTTTAILDCVGRRIDGERWKFRSQCAIAKLTLDEIDEVSADLAEVVECGAYKDGLSAIIMFK